MIASRWIVRRMPLLVRNSCRLSRTRSNTVASISVEEHLSSWRSQESARELQQSKAKYRCCIPALAGFFRLQSIVPGKVKANQLGLFGNFKITCVIFCLLRQYSKGICYRSACVFSETISSCKYGKISRNPCDSPDAVSAVLGYLNQVKFTEVKKRAADAEITVSQTKTQLAKAQGDLKTASQNLANTVSEKDQLTSRLSGVQTDLEKTKAQVAQLTNDRTSLEAQISQLTADLQAKTQELEQKSTPGSASPAEGGAISRLRWPNSKP